jgi:hypothetical protein
MRRHILPQKQFKWANFWRFPFKGKRIVFAQKKELSVAFSQIFTQKKKTDGQISSV